MPDEAQPLSSGPRPGDPEAAAQGQQAQGAAAPSGEPGPESPKPEPGPAAGP
ncbi:RDD family protein, partial [Streptomyces sp. SID7982]|nr:RDD family protein [Streptomyces sp. SID7982]